MDITSIALDPAPAPGRSAPLSPHWEPHGARTFVLGASVVGGLEVQATCAELGSGRRYDLTVRHPGGPGATPRALSALRLRLAGQPRRALEHGWQSWSSVARRTLSEASAARRIAPAWVRAVYHAAPETAGRVVSGDQFLLMADGCGPHGADGGVAGFLDGRRHLSTVVAAPRGVFAVALLDGIVLAPGEEWALDPLFVAAGDPGPLYSEYLDHWGAVAGARTTGASPAGWSSWYHYFAKITPADLRANLDIAARRGFELLQIDDGFQRSIGDWLEPNERFAADPARALAADIAGRGLQPGIWTAPFLASPTSRLATEHPEWLAGRRGGAPGQGRPSRAMWNPVSWGGWALGLDTTHPGLLEHLRAVFARLVEDGFSYHKIDFCYSAAVAAARRGDGVSTRAQALRAGLEAVRQGIGQQSVLLGCGMPLGPAVGVVDAMRVSADTGPSWAPGPVRLPGYPDLAPAASSALQASVLRAPMHRRLWVNDPDCLLLRPTGTRLHEGQRRLLAAAVGGTGDFAIVSDDLATYRTDEWEVLDRLRGLHDRADTLLDLADPFAPAPRVTGRRGVTLDVDWGEGSTDHRHRHRYPHRPARPVGRDPGDPPPAPVVLEGASVGHGAWARLSVTPPPVSPASAPSKSPRH